MQPILIQLIIISRNFCYYMTQEIEALIINDLRSNQPCIPSYYAQRFPRIAANDLLQIFIGIYKRDAGIKYDLLCHLIIFNNNKMHIQNQRYSNIQKGVIINHQGQAIEFNKNQIRELKILAIFPNTINISTIQQTIQKISNVKKSKDYHNRFTILPKLLVENKINDKSKNKKEEKQKQQAKVEKKQQKKELKKTNSKSSIEMEPTKPQGLKKVSSKDQTPQPILTAYQAQRKKVQEAIIQQRPKTSLKMQLDSEEDYYNPQKPEQLQQLINNKQVETDMSGKKNKEQNMQIESQRQKPEKTLNKFIVNDEDDEEDEIFNKMEEIANKPLLSQTQKASQSQTRQKSETNKLVQKKDPPKQILTAKQIPSSKPAVQTKQPPSIMNWLKPKQLS